jgi:hypothetical protein
VHHRAMITAASSIVSAYTLHHDSFQRSRAHKAPRRARGRGLALSTLLIVAICATSTAQARDMTGKGGLGTLVPTSDVLGTTPVIALRYWRRQFAFEMHVGFDWLRSTDSVDTFDARKVHAGLGVIWALVDGPRVSAGFGLRGWLQIGSFTSTNSITGDNKSGNDVGVLLEALLVAEWFLSDHVGISAAVGPSLYLANSFVSSAKKDPKLQELIGPNLTSGGGLIELGGRYSGGLGLTYYF